MIDALDSKLLNNFRGKVVRKDLNLIVKKSINVPSFVLDYLLGMYCASDDEAVIQTGMDKIKMILANNCVKPEQSEYIKSKIRENSEYTIIDRISVKFDEREDKYIAYFTNLKIDPFEVNSDLVIHNEKLLLGGVWCLVKIKYTKYSDEEDEEDIEDIFGHNHKAKAKKQKKSKYHSPFSIANLKPIQMPNLNIHEFISKRSLFTTQEWINVILRSAGYEPEQLNRKQQLHYLLRLVPMAQKNYNMVELGPRGTGKSHVYSEVSPHSILLSGGSASIASLFYNISRREIGLVGKWDTIAFDEVGGLKSFDASSINFMKNYMANGTFARDKNSYSADGSFAFEGNTMRSVFEMIRVSNLFEPFPKEVNNDSAFFDRIHAYLPGWETPKLKSSLFTNHYGFISDCVAEYLHEMRRFDFGAGYRDYFTLNKAFNIRDEQAVIKTFSGLAKIIFPDGNMEKEEVRMLLEYAIECRRRVKEQLKKMTPVEFNAVELGYIDNDTDVEYIIEMPEQPKSLLVSEEAEMPGHVYSIGRSVKNITAAYRLEFKLLDNGDGRLDQKNIEGIDHSSKNVRTALTAGFNYFISNLSLIYHRIDPTVYNYSLFYNDLQARGISDEVTVAEVVGLCSAVLMKPVMASTVVIGRVVMSGSMMPLSTSLPELLMAVNATGAKKVLLPKEAEVHYIKLPDNLKDGINAIFYSTPIEAAKIALGLTE